MGARNAHWNSKCFLLLKWMLKWDCFSTCVLKANASKEVWASIWFQQISCILGVLNTNGKEPFTISVKNPAFFIKNLIFRRVFGQKSIILVASRRSQSQSHQSSHKGSHIKSQRGIPQPLQVPLADRLPGSPRAPGSWRLWESLPLIRALIRQEELRAQGSGLQVSRLRAQGSELRAHFIIRVLKIPRFCRKITYFGTSGSRQQAAGSRQAGRQAGSRQQAAGSRQQAGRQAGR